MKINIDLSFDPRTVIAQTASYRLNEAKQLEISAAFLAAEIPVERQKFADQLVIGSLYFVATTAYTIADTRKKRGMAHFPDLFNCGVQELIENQLKRYDKNGHGGAPFIGFAAKGIKGAMMDYMRMHVDSAVKLPEGFDYKTYQPDVSIDGIEHAGLPQPRQYIPNPYYHQPDDVVAWKQLLTRAFCHYGAATERQRAILDAVLEGSKQPDIAAQLGVSERTVQRDRDALQAVLGNFMS